MVFWCSILAVACISRSKRPTACRFDEKCVCRSFTATMRFMAIWRALKTTPMPPDPSTEMIS
ncbi:MAG: hypothetical protein U1F43_31345 [Myxococcota bacterium]